MKYFILTFLSCSFLLFNANAQVVKTDMNEMKYFSNNDEGSVNIIQNSRLQTIVDNHRIGNKSKSVWGWRVQIFFGSGTTARRTAENIKKDFLRKFPDIPAYLVYEAPFFKVRVGNFRSRLEAAKTKKIMEKSFTNIFIVEEKIENVTDN